MVNLLLFVLAVLILMCILHAAVFEIIRRRVLELGHTPHEEVSSVSFIGNFLEANNIRASEDQVKLALEEAKTLVKFLNITEKNLRNASDVLVLILAKSLIGSGAIQASAYNLQKQSSEVAVKLPPKVDADATQNTTVA
jgi:hypothetical protein